MLLRNVVRRLQHIQRCLNKIRAQGKRPRRETRDFGHDKFNMKEIYHLTQRDTKSELLGFSIRLNPKVFWFLLFCLKFLALKYFLALIFLLLSLKLKFLVFSDYYLFSDFHILVLSFLFLIYSFEFLFLFRLSFFQALPILIVKQKNYMLHIHQTVYCTQYIIYYNQSLVHQKQAKDEDLYETRRGRHKRKLI